MEAARASKLWMRQPKRGQRWNGGACLGPNPNTSVANGDCQFHDVPNLFDLGASSCATLSGYPATVTIGALCCSSADYIKRQKS